jgi:hypothetical protein
VCRGSVTQQEQARLRPRFAVAIAQHLCQKKARLNFSAEPRLHCQAGGVLQERMMQYVCDAPPKTWFRIETEGEAALESRAMNHAVEKYFLQAFEHATMSYVPPRSAHYIEQNIGLKAHIQRVMPLFLTLRDGEGRALATAMLPPQGKDDRTFKPIIVGVENCDPYPEHGEAIRLLAKHFGLTLDPARCFPYRRG